MTHARYNIARLWLSGWSDLDLGFARSDHRPESGKDKYILWKKLVKTINAIIFPKLQDISIYGKIAAKCNVSERFAD